MVFGLLEKSLEKVAVIFEKSNGINFFFLEKFEMSGKTC